jgi:hypothetical protein
VSPADDIARGRTGDPIVAGARVDELDVRGVHSREVQRVGAGRQPQRVVAAAAVDGFDSGKPRKPDDIVPGAAENAVETRTAIDDVETGIAAEHLEGVVPALARELVVAAAALDHIGSRRADEHVVGDRPRKDAAGSSLDGEEHRRGCRRPLAVAERVGEAGRSRGARRRREHDVARAVERDGPARAAGHRQEREAVAVEIRVVGQQGRRGDDERRALARDKPGVGHGLRRIVHRRHEQAEAHARRGRAVGGGDAKVERAMEMRRRRAGEGAGRGIERKPGRQGRAVASARGEGEPVPIRIVEQRCREREAPRRVLRRGLVRHGPCRDRAVIGDDRDLHLGCGEPALAVCHRVAERGHALELGRHGQTQPAVWLE